ncbi:MAG TPA: non-heme iron oxygenase ferredoxin subunit [Stellaceae bacterium]|jgi:nitrite reductase/ring-hydroxylating ferredoxin subunit|nr:non-heme iron oxygenase ferredoxin subunit [Stellaceae bacterium]
MAEIEQWVRVASRADLGEGEMLGVSAAGREIALYDVGGQVYATDNVCTHAFAMLTDGWLDGDEIECPLHGGRFNVISGKGLGPPIPCDVKIYKLRIAGDAIEIAIPMQPVALGPGGA